MLSIKGLNVFYGAIQALNNVSVSVNRGEIVAIIGSNGAGKSTLLRTISGLVPPRSGEILFEPSPERIASANGKLKSTVATAVGGGVELVGMAPHDIVKLGLSHAPEGRRIFTNMSVRENLLMGAYLRNDSEVASDIQNVLDRFPRLRERFHQDAGTMSGGEQQMLAIGRALMSRPDILLLDEPSLGLAPFLIAEIFQIVLDLNKMGVTILIVEQNANRALEIAHRAYVLETGVLVLEGTGQELLVDPKVKEAYLGG
jgi:branched-chain amino acid transport system ATP-binding protein